MNFFSLQGAMEGTCTVSLFQLGYGCLELESEAEIHQNMGPSSLKKRHFVIVILVWLVSLGCLAELTSTQGQTAVN